MKFLNSKTIFLTLVFISIMISSTDLCFSVENHNSSRSNRGQIIFPGGGSSDSINAITIKKILDDIDNATNSGDTKPGEGSSNKSYIRGATGGADRESRDRLRINEQFVRNLLNKYGIKFINKIIVEKDKQGLYNIILLIDPKNEAKARHEMSKNIIQNIR